MAKRTGFKVLLKRETATPGTFATIAQVTNVTPPQYSRETVDVTDKDSVGGYREYIGNLIDGGEVSCEILYDPDDHNTLLADFEDDQPINWQVEFPTSPVKKQSFAALLTGFAPAAPMDAALTATITLKVSGKPTWS